METCRPIEAKGGGLKERGRGKGSGATAAVQAAFLADTSYKSKLKSKKRVVVCACVFQKCQPQTKERIQIQQI